MTKSIQLWLSKEEIQMTIDRYKTVVLFSSNWEEIAEATRIVNKLEKALKKAGKDE